MRVRVIFKLKNKGAFLPFHHQYILAQFIKGLIIKGGKEQFVNYPFYNFSGLKGQTRISRNGLQYFSNLVTLVLSSADQDFIDYVLEQIFEFDEFRLGNLDLEPVSTELEDIPDFSDEMKFLCISPLVALKSDFASDEGKRFVLPEANEFSDLLYESTMERIEQSGSFSAERLSNFGKFQLVPDMEYLDKLKQRDKKFARIYSLFDMDVKYEVRGYTLPFKLYAPKEVQQFVFNCGLGHYAYKGFGMLDMANVNPTDRTSAYTFNKVRKIV